jgi:hypothetical protein
MAFVVAIAAKHAEIADVVRPAMLQRHDMIDFEVDDAAALHALRLVVAQLL